MERREDQRLRIGDLWPAGEHVGRPQWRLAFVERPREKLQFRLKLRLGGPRKRDRAREPRPREDEEGNQINRSRRKQRKGPTIVVLILVIRHRDAGFQTRAPYLSPLAGSELNRRVEPAELHRIALARKQREGLIEREPHPVG